MIIWRLLGISVLVLSLDWTMQAQEKTTEEMMVKGSDFPKKVLTFYYGWYGRPEISGKWVHWKEVDEGNQTIGSSANYPSLGAYDSHDPGLIEKHCQWAKEAGVDAFIAT